jgi:hypothetical protein
VVVGIAIAIVYRVFESYCVLYLYRIVHRRGDVVRGGCWLLLLLG